jgi:hypothetical protein
MGFGSGSSPIGNVGERGTNAVHMPSASRTVGSVVSIDDVRDLARTLPRSYEVLVRDHVKFRVGRLVYLAFSRDEQIMGFAFPKEQREGLIASEPEKFLLPRQSDMRYNWVHGRLSALALDEMRELVIDAWTMVVPKSVAGAYLEAHSRSA